MACDIWHMTVKSYLVLVLLLVLLATCILNDLPGLTSCHCDSIGLVPLILLDWELRVLHHCTKHPDLVSLDFLCHPYIPILI